MAEEKTDAREVAWRHLFPWTELFRGFQVALDPNKLLLAAAGIFFMAVGWWLLAVVFSSGYKSLPPEIGAPEYQSITDLDQRWKKFKQDRDSWNLANEAMDIARGPKSYEIEDLAQSWKEYEALQAIFKANKEDMPEKDLRAAIADPRRVQYIAKRFHAAKPAGTLSTWPWTEERGPNPFLLVTGQARGDLWEPGNFWGWFTTNQLPVMIEPLIKIVRPIVYYFSPRADTYLRFYFLFVTIWTVLVWSVFGGAITRIAAVQLTRGEKIGLGESVRFTMKRLLSYVAAPLFPLVFVFALLIFTVIFGWFFMIPVVGDILVGGFFWVVPLLIGLIMACALVGLAVGWPLMAPTISTEGTDSWEAVSRSYSYVFQRPWQYIWYGLVGTCYAALAVFFIGFMGSFTVYMAKWSVSQTPAISVADREPTFLFVYAPKSFGWRTLLLQGATVDGNPIVRDGVIDEPTYQAYLGYRWDDTVKNYVWAGKEASKDALTWYNKLGAVIVAFWLGLLFLMIIGFGYSFFWSLSTIIYLLMRRSVDAAELDEVYLEEEEPEGLGTGFPTPPPAPPGAIKQQPALTMVEPPVLRPTAPPPPAAPPAPPVTSPPVTHTPAPPPTPVEVDKVPVTEPTPRAGTTTVNKPETPVSKPETSGDGGTNGPAGE